MVLIDVVVDDRIKTRNRYIRNLKKENRKVRFMRERERDTWRETQKNKICRTLPRKDKTKTA
jgi:hypothetical protein